jgi:hypothetical protein
MQRVSVGLDCQPVFPESEDTTKSEPLRPGHSKNAQCAVCIGENSGQCAGCAQHSCQIASDCGRRTPTLGQSSRVCELGAADQVTCYTRQNLLHAMALPIDGASYRAEAL